MPKQILFYFKLFIFQISVLILPQSTVRINFMHFAMVLVLVVR